MREKKFQLYLKKKPNWQWLTSIELYFFLLWQQPRGRLLQISVQLLSADIDTSGFLSLSFSTFSCWFFTLNHVASWLQHGCCRSRHHVSSLRQEDRKFEKNQASKLSCCSSLSLSPTHPHTQTPTPTHSHTHSHTHTPDTHTHFCLWLIDQNYVIWLCLAAVKVEKVTMSFHSFYSRKEARRKIISSQPINIVTMWHWS